MWTGCPTTATDLQRVPEGERQGAGGFIDRVVPRDAGAEHDHVDQSQEALPVLHLVQEGPGEQRTWVRVAPLPGSSGLTHITRCRAVPGKTAGEEQQVRNSRLLRWAAWSPALTGSGSPLRPQQCGRFRVMSPCPRSGLPGAAALGAPAQEG